jgi:hypothetical protein
VRNVWTDIDPINSAAAERLGYQIQKPEELFAKRLVSLRRAVPSIGRIGLESLRIG